MKKVERIEEMKLIIKAVSGAERGKEGSGQKFVYSIEKEVFLSLVGEVFDREVAAYKPENAKSGGAVSGFLHAYGVTADRMDKAGRVPFPAEGGEFTSEHVQDWLEVMEFKAPRNPGVRMSKAEVEKAAMLASVKSLKSMGVWQEAMAAGFPLLSKEEIAQA